MSQGFRQSQALLHTWSGLLLGWVLFLVFVAGTIAFGREALNRWMRPELPRVEQPLRALDGAQRFLEAKVPDAKSWFITMANARSPGAALFWQPQPKPGEPRGRGRGGRGRRDTQALIDANGQVSTARDTRGGEFFYRFHFDLHYMPVIWARWLVGLATMMMLVAILSGIVTHKKIFRDFFTLRRGKGQRSWLDGHNATAVLALPFHLMITYTGLVTLMALLMPWAVVANYADETGFSKTVFPQAEAVERTGVAAPMVRLTDVVRDAERRLGGPAGYVEVAEAGDRAQRISVTRAAASMLNTRPPRVTYDGTTGALIWQSPPPGAAAVTAGAMIGLHAGRFADPVTRWIYFLGGVAGSLMVASGLVMWTVKRREKLPDPTRPYLGFRVVERLNIAFIAGFPLGTAAMLWANRLLPAGMADRAAWEVHWLFIVWGAAAVAGFIQTPKRAWAWQLAATGLMLVMLPLFNMVATRVGLPATLMSGDWALASIDAVLLLFGIGYLAVARRVSRYRPKATRRRESRVAAKIAPRRVALEPAA
ncbi:putative iron-regulated membrane protein [Sphingomonas jejuensis]|uniref:Iron-regulated membrane protein n=1 Tax=Sphingomonas jejuensis TaxID=904715 RepID=A0ABX0XRI3_9SPHN|nr:PepSY-associated TM helix domain-containing protein [Sphingomonas jejuensis]NJC35251.1 putative iron-regulated membrane protein [Sphingomonas jejuensis]